jgi:hypothetical protein
LSEAERFLRHHLLAGIGPDGQARVQRSAARLSGPGEAHEIAELYARASGFASVTAGAIDLDALAPEDVVRTPAARAVCAGARAALVELRLAARGGLGGGDAPT